MLREDPAISDKGMHEQRHTQALALEPLIGCKARQQDDRDRGKPLTPPYISAASSSPSRYAVVA